MRQLTLLGVAFVPVLTVARPQRSRPPPRRSKPGSVPSSGPSPTRTALAGPSGPWSTPPRRRSATRPGQTPIDPSCSALEAGGLARRAGRSADADPPRHVRSDGLPPTPEEVGLPRGRAGRVREGGRPAAGQPALRRALGPALARRGPLRRHQRPRREHRPRQRLALSRLRRRRRSTTTSPTTSSSASNWPATCCPRGDASERERLIATGFLAARPQGRWPRTTRRRWRWTSSTSRSTRSARRSSA